MTQQSLTDYTASTDNANDTDDEQTTSEDGPETDITGTETREDTASESNDDTHETGETPGITTSDGGIPFTDIFHETGATRINELELLEDENNRLYACVEADTDTDADAIELSNRSIFAGGIMSDDDRTITPKPGTAVRVDATTGSVESITCDELKNIDELNALRDEETTHTD